MQLFQITVPLADNQGRPMQEAHGLFARAILKTAGGFTSADAWGEHDAPPYVGGEAVRVYTFGVADVSLTARILSHAKTYFPDQSSFFLAHVGTAMLAPGRAAEGVTSAGRSGRTVEEIDANRARANLRAASQLEAYVEGHPWEDPLARARAI